MPLLTNTLDAKIQSHHAADGQSGGAAGDGWVTVSLRGVHCKDENIDPTLDRPLGGPASVRRSVDLREAGAAISACATGNFTAETHPHHFAERDGQHRAGGADVRGAAG